jgi:hypothetical protein
MADKRVVLGKKGSDYVLQISKAGTDVIDDAPNTRDLLFNSLDTYRSGVIVSDTTISGTMSSSGVALVTTADSNGTAYIPAYQIIEKGVKSNFTEFQETTNLSFAGIQHTLEATVAGALPTSAGGGLFELSLGGSGSTLNLVRPTFFDITEVEDPTGSVNGNYPYIEYRSRGSGDGDVEVLMLRIPCQYGKMTNNAALFGNSELTPAATGGGGSGGSGGVSAPADPTVTLSSRNNTDDTVVVSSSSGSGNSGTITFAQTSTNVTPTSGFTTTTTYTQPRNSTRYYWASQSSIVSGSTSFISPAVDSTPNAFSFTPVLNAGLNSTNTSNTITIAGLGDGDTATVSLSGTAGSKQYSKNGGSYTSSSGTAQNGDTFAVRGTASGSYSSTVTVILTVGGVSGTYSISTQGVPADTTPDAFNFTDQSNLNLNTLIYSNTVTISGINQTVSVSATNGAQFSINGGSYVTSGSISNGQTLRIRLTSSGSYNTTTSTTVTVGGTSDVWSITTRSAVVASPPTALTLTQTTNTAASSQTVTATASGGSGTPQVSNDGSNWQSNGYSFSQSRTGTAVTYYARNAGEVNSSSITATKVVPPVVTLSGIGNFTGRSAAGENNTYAPTAQRAGGNYNTYASYWGTTTTSISNNSGGWLSSTITNSSLGYFNLTSQSNPSTSSRTATVTYTTSTQFGYSHTMTFTFQQDGQVADTTPNQFTFTDYTNATVNTTYNSSVTITGINTAVTAVYTGDANGSFSTDNSTFNQSNKTVNNGDTIYLRLPSSASASTTRTATITIGSISDTMTVTTAAAADSTPDAFSFTDVTGADILSIYSDTVTITGINTSVTATITTTDGAIFKVNNGTANTSSKTVVNNDTITVSIATTADSFTLHEATITVGGVSDTFSVTTGSSGGEEP